MQKRLEATLETMNSRESVVVIDSGRKGGEPRLWGKPFNAEGRSERVENLMEGANICAESSEVVRSFSKL